MNPLKVALRVCYVQCEYDSTRCKRFVNFTPIPFILDPIYSDAMLRKLSEEQAGIPTGSDSAKVLQRWIRPLLFLSQE
jgi:hypothetical protein